MADPLDEAHERLMEAVRASRRNAVMAEATQPLHYAREAIVSAWPLLPALIEERIGEADARIFNQDDLRRLLAEFAVDVLVTQQNAVDRWINAKHRVRRTRIRTRVEGADER